jgi:hypothetical protein
MLSAAIAYQVLQQENRQTIEKVEAVLEKHPRYANQWQSRLQDVPVADGLVLFMQASRWADAPGTRLKIDSLGTTSTYHSNPKGNRQTSKSEIPTQ